MRNRADQSKIQFHCNTSIFNVAIVRSPVYSICRPLQADFERKEDMAEGPRPGLFLVKLKLDGDIPNLILGDPGTLSVT
jgi:hypothetical protein